MINLGAGLRPLAGYVNVDQRALPGIDVIHDLAVTPWPFETESALAITAIDVFEHLADVVSAMDECWRILRSDGTLTVRGPLPESPNLWVDVTHRRAFVEGSFDHFDWSTEFGQRYRYGRASWTIVSRQREETNMVFVLKPDKVTVTP